MIGQVPRIRKMCLFFASIARSPGLPGGMGCVVAMVKGPHLPRAPLGADRTRLGGLEHSPLRCFFLYRRRDSE